MTTRDEDVIPIRPTAGTAGTFSEDLVHEAGRNQYRAQGLWDWVRQLGAKRWRHVYVAFRPER